MRFLTLSFLLKNSEDVVALNAMATIPEGVSAAQWEVFQNAVWIGGEEAAFLTNAALEDFGRQVRPLGLRVVGVSREETARDTWEAVPPAPFHEIGTLVADVTALIERNLDAFTGT